MKGWRGGLRTAISGRFGGGKERASGMQNILPLESGLARVTQVDTNLARIGRGQPGNNWAKEIGPKKAGGGGPHTQRTQLYR